MAKKYMIARVDSDLGIAIKLSGKIEEVSARSYTEALQKGKEILGLKEGERIAVRWTGDERFLSWRIYTLF